MRDVRLSSAGMVAAAGAVVLAAAGVFGGIWLYLAATRDQKEPVAVEAEVVEVGRRRGEGQQHFVVYQFVAGETLYRRRVNIRRSDSQRWKVGSRVEVRYESGRPERSWFPDHEPKGVPLWAVPLAPAGLGACAWAIVWSIRRQWRLLETGRVAEARVTRSEKFQHSHGGGHHVYYEFRVLSGARRSGRHDTAKAPPAGTGLTILYDPDDADRQGRYPLSLVRAAISPLALRPVSRYPGSRGKARD